MLFIVQTLLNRNQLKMWIKNIPDSNPDGVFTGDKISWSR